MNSNNKLPDLESQAAAIPASTYRLQFSRQFTFGQAADIADYLRELGISHLYASPLFQAGPESTHGYDTCNFQQVSTVLGGRSEFDAFTDRLRQLDLGLLLDMVPNHMGSDLSNAWWRDVLENGPSSPYANYFDIDWQPACSNWPHKVLLPTLEDHYATVLEQGKLALAYERGTFAIAYHERRFPISPASVAEILEEVARALVSFAKEPELIDDLCDLSATLLETTQTHSIRLSERLCQWEDRFPDFRKAVDRVRAAYNGQLGKPESFHKLHTLIAHQHYRLAFWRVGSQEINYRRFFDVTQLVSIKMESPPVFESAHRLVFELLRQGQLQGLRIDHPDGLWDPKEYFRKLQSTFLQACRSPAPVDSVRPSIRPGQNASGWEERLAQLEEVAMHRAAAEKGAETAARCSTMTSHRVSCEWPLYVVVEKILSGNESLRRDWPVAGTTGYDFLNQVNGVFVNGANAVAFDRIYREFTRSEEPFWNQVYASKQRILDTSLASELNALSYRLKGLCSRTRYGHDFTLAQLRIVLRDVIAAFPVYRTYVTESATQISLAEEECIRQAIEKAKSRNADTEEPVLEFLQELLLLRSPGDYTAKDRSLHWEFVLRFQQLTGPATAKGLEDTAFYNYSRLLSLNEVGGDADRFGVTVDEFHRHNARISAQWPHTILATATHDTKRGEDVRARLNVLSEMPDEWEAALRRWAKFNSDKKVLIHGQLVPRSTHEYFIYQTLLGAWPMSDKPTETESNPVDVSRILPDNLPHFVRRVTEYLIKALREGKSESGWTDPNATYEEGTTKFAEALLNPSASAPFLLDFARIQARVRFFGQVNSLAQLVLKATSPGVPDFYQGTEFWDLSLVDPDNRQPVNFPLRRRLLFVIRQQLASSNPDRLKLSQELLARSHTGEVKLYVTHLILQFRLQHAAHFREASYCILAPKGVKADHVCAFARVGEQQSVITIVPRLPLTLTNGVAQWPVGETVWRDTSIEIPEGLSGHYQNVLTGEALIVSPDVNGRGIMLGVALRQFPVALLVRTTPSKAQVATA